MNGESKNSLCCCRWPVIDLLDLATLVKQLPHRLLDCGHSLTVWNRTPSKAEDMQVEKTSSPVSITNKTEIIFICLFDSKAVHSILSRENGLLSGDISGKIIVDLSTNHFRDIKVFHELCNRDNRSFYKIETGERRQANGK